MNILRCRKGATAIEYALVATLIAVAAIFAFQNLGNKLGTTYNNVGNALP
jgi:pilus assembly protein Flp/PilA